MTMCNECDATKGWKFCPHCGAELKQAAKPESKEPMTQEKFDEIFLDILKSYSKIAWIDDNGNESDIPTSRYVLKNAAGEWLFDIDLDPKHQHFWYSATRVTNLFLCRWSLGYRSTRELMKNQLSKRFKMTDPDPIHI